MTNIKEIEQALDNAKQAIAKAERDMASETDPEKRIALLKGLTDSINELLQVGSAAKGNEPIDYTQRGVSKNRH